MYLLYSVLLTVGFIALLPKFVIEALRSRKYITGLSQRLGKLPVIASSDYPIVWLHCVSVGETEAARPFVREFLDRFPSYRLVVSTTTVAGQKLARTLYGHRAAVVFYFPIDWAWTVRRVLRRIKPSALFVMETELWPRLFRECHMRSIPVALLNGRISPTSFCRYRLTGSFMRRVLDDLSIAMMQSEPDATRIRDLGLPAERVLVLGNLKFDSAETALDDAVTNELRLRFGIDGKRPLIVAASTHAPEERVILEAFKQIKYPVPARDARVGRPRPGRRQRRPRLVRADRRRRDEPPTHEVRYPHEPPLERAEQSLAVERLDDRPAAHARTVARMPPQPRTSRPGARRTSPAIAGPTSPHGQHSRTSRTSSPVTTNPG